MLEIKKLKVTNPRKGGSKSFFKVDLVFITDTQEWFGELKDWYEVGTIRDLDTYNKEQSKLSVFFEPMPNKKTYKLTCLGEQTVKNEVRWTRGRGSINEVKSRKAHPGSRKFTYTQYITRTEVTLALVKEMQKMRADSSYTVGVIRECYFANLLRALDFFWD